MGTLEEAMAEAVALSDDELITPVNDILMINPETREIDVPASEMLFGVRTDRNVERKYFKCPKIVGNDIDLSQHKIYVIYQKSDEKGTNVYGKPSRYWCEDMTTDETGDYITFSWILSGKVLDTAGFIAFKILASYVDSETGSIKTRWNTIPSVGVVKFTLSDGSEVIEQYTDVITQLLQRMEEVEAIATPEAMQGYVEQYFNENPLLLDETLTADDKAAPANLVGELKDDLDYLAKESGCAKHTQYIDRGTLVQGYYWNYADTTTEQPTWAGYGSADMKGLRTPLELTGGTTYYYNNISAYFSLIVDKTTNYVENRLSNVGQNGTYTPSKDCLLYISVDKDAAESPMFADGKLPDDYIYGTYYISDEPIIVDINGNGDFTKFSDAILYAYDKKDLTIIVKKGSYDLISELGETKMIALYSGLYIGNNTTIIMEEGAEVCCNYDGSNATINSKFSILNSAPPTWENHNYKLVNFKCKATNIRYCIHDEMDSRYTTYTHIFENCDFYLDNSNNQNWDSYQCIGGGLGTNGNIIIDGCIFDGNILDNVICSYHNHSSANSVSKITIKNCYFRNGKLEFYNYGQQTEKTICKVSNNSLKYMPLINGYSGYPEMIELLMWNNEIRN